MKKLIIATILLVVLITAVTAAFAAPGGKIDLSDPRVIECGAAYPDGGQAYFDCLADAGVTSTAGGGGGHTNNGHTK